MEGVPKPNRMSPEAEKLRDQRDGFHFTEAEREADQKAFEKRMRLDLPYEEREGSLYGHGNVMHRETANTMYEKTAEQQNSYRSFLQKMFGRGKVAPSEIMRDEADRLNELVDTRVSKDEGWTSHQEAADSIVNESSEFNNENYLTMYGDMNERRVGIKGFINAYCPEIEKEMARGDIAQAFWHFDRLSQEMWATGDGELLDKDFYELYIKDKLESLIASHDSESIARAREQINTEAHQFLSPNLRFYKDDYLGILDKLD